MNEVKLPKIPPTADGVKVTIHATREDEAHRPPTQVGLGCEFIGAALPHPDPSDVPTFVAGVLKRFAFKPPALSRVHAEGLAKFTLEFCRKWLVPLDPRLDCTVEAWLSTCNYPDWRKKELLAKWKKCGGLLEAMHFLVKMFEKDEVYEEFKHARAINSRTDEFKCAVGPIFRLIEKQLFQMPWFIKKVPKNDRPAFIRSQVERVDAMYLATDYSAFEAHFTKEIMEIVEFQMYEYMTKALPDGPAWFELVQRVIGGRNRCVNKNLTVEIDATRMSGEMNTSLGNSFSNLIFMLYAAECCGCKDVRGVVEGDDGLFSMQVPEGCAAPSIEFFATMGLTMKLEAHSSLSTASFCGLVFDDVDLKNVTNPLAELVSFGYAQRRYAGSSRKTKEQLLRCKSFSMVYEYNGCPILGSLGKMGLRLTARHGAVGSKQMETLVDRFATNIYLREQALEALGVSSTSGLPEVKVGMRTRLLVERLYGIPVEAQLEMELYLDSIKSLQEIRFDRLLALCPTEWRDYYQDYSAYVVPTDQNRPMGRWNKSSDNALTEYISRADGPVAASIGRHFVT